MQDLYMRLENVLFKYQALIERCHQINNTIPNIQDIDALISQHEKRIEEMIQFVVTDFENTLASQLEQTCQSLLTALQDSTSSLEAEIKQYSDQTKNNAIDAAEQLNNTITGGLEELKNNVTILNESQLADLEQVTEGAEDTYNEVKKTISQLQSDITMLCTNISEHTGFIANQADELIHHLDVTCVQLQNTFVTSVDTLVTSVNTETTKLHDTYLAISNEIKETHEWVANTKEIISDGIEQSNESLDTVIEVLQACSQELDAIG